jgi:hypothetical protein
MFWRVRAWKIRTRERFWLWLARHCPKPLVYWCAIVLGAHATTGKYSHTIVPELSFMDALDRYSTDYPLD